MNNTRSFHVLSETTDLIQYLKITLWGKHYFTSIFQMKCVSAGTHAPNTRISRVPQAVLL